MQIIINANPVPLDSQAITQIERRMYFALGRFAGGIRLVSVRLIDMNRPTGGLTKQCLIVVKLQRGGEILIQGKGVDNASVVNHCADRMSRAVNRALSRDLQAAMVQNNVSERGDKTQHS